MCLPWTYWTVVWKAVTQGWWKHLWRDPSPRCSWHGPCTGRFGRSEGSRSTAFVSWGCRSLLSWRRPPALWKEGSFRTWWKFHNATTFLLKSGTQRLTQVIIDGCVDDLVGCDVAVSLCGLPPADLSDSPADDVKGQTSWFTRPWRRMNQTPVLTKSRFCNQADTIASICKC